MELVLCIVLFWVDELTVGLFAELHVMVLKNM